MKTLEKTIYTTTKSKTRILSIALFIALLIAVAASSLWFATDKLQATPNYVPINGWTATSTLPVALAAMNAIEHNDNLYLIGGRKANGNPTTKVYRAQINADGSLSAWGTTTPLPQSLYLHSVSATDTNVYVVGGWKGTSPVEKIVYRAPFTQSGELGAWVNVQQDYPSEVRDDGKGTGIDLHGSVIVGDRIYGFGGRDGFQDLKEVHSAAINANGSLGAWRSETLLPKALYRHAVVEHNGYVYVTGGVSGPTTSAASQVAVYYARVNSNGALGAWQTGTNLPTATYYHRVVIHDGKLVLLGGADDSSEFNTAYSANINANGSIGSWAAEPSLPRTMFRFAAVSVEKYGSDYLYVMGGFSNGSVQSSVYHSAVPPTPTPTNTPTPTATPTPTPTPTPPVSVYATVSNEPSHWVAVGEEITYTITYGNDGSLPVSDANVNSTIPDNTELVTGTVSDPPLSSVSASSAGGVISWSVGTLNPNTSGSMTYTVRRIAPPPPEFLPPVAIDLEILGPSTAVANAPITYTMIITNEATLVQNAKASIRLPVGSNYIGHSGEAVLNGDTLEWTFDTFPGLTTKQVDFVVFAPQTILLKDYKVQGEVPGLPLPDNITRSSEDRVLVTKIGDTPPPDAGDKTVIVNNNATISWVHNNRSDNILLNSVQNPSPAPIVTPIPRINSLFLPLINQ